MDVFCEVCGKKWDQQDPAVRFVYGDGRWECVEEVPCFGRREALETAFGSMAPMRPGK